MRTDACSDHELLRQIRPKERESIMDNLLKDLRYGVRHLLKNRGFTAVAVIALALGTALTPRSLA